MIVIIYKYRALALTIYLLTAHLSPASIYAGSNPYKDSISTTFIHSTFKKAKRASRTSGKPVFAFVYTDWSLPSKKMIDSTFLSKQIINELSSDYECVLINGKKKKSFREEYHVDIYPTMFVTDYLGKVIIRSKGYKKPDELIQFLAKTRSNSRYLKQSLDTIIGSCSRSNILIALDSVRYYKDDYAAKNLAKKYLDQKTTDWRDQESMYLIQEFFSLDKKYLKFLSKYHYKFFERFDSTLIKENIAFHIYLENAKLNRKGRLEFDYKHVNKWFNRYNIEGAERLESFVIVRRLLTNRGPSIRSSEKLLQNYPETKNENVLYASTIRLLVSKTRRNIDYDKLIESLEGSITEDGTYWKYDLLSLLYYKIGKIKRSNNAINTAKSIAQSTSQKYNPTLPYLAEAIDAIPLVE